MSDLYIEENFYNNPKLVRAFALNKATYCTDKNLSSSYSGTESLQSYYSEDVIQKIEKIIGRQIVVDTNQFSFGVFVKKTLNDHSKKRVHIDRSEWTAIVYLSQNPKPNSGTAIYLHKKTGLAHFEKQYKDQLEADGNDESAWAMTASIGNKFNRIVVFRSGMMFHAGMKYFGKTDEDCRLTQVFFFNEAEVKS
jgi:hypothetical protein